MLAQPARVVVLAFTNVHPNRCDRVLCVVAIESRHASVLDKCGIVCLREVKPNDLVVNKSLMFWSKLTNASIELMFLVVSATTERG